MEGERWKGKVEEGLGWVWVGVVIRLMSEEIRLRTLRLDAVQLVLSVTVAHPRTAHVRTHRGIVGCKFGGRNGLIAILLGPPATTTGPTAAHRTPRHPLEGDIAK